MTRYGCLKINVIFNGEFVADVKTDERDSGWALSRILYLMVNVNKCNPMRVGCWMKIPLGIRHKQVVVNVRSENDACFARAVVAALYPDERHAERCGSYPDYATNDVSINVFANRDGIEKKAKFGRGAGDNAIVPLRLTDDKRDKHVNLLYLRDTLRGVNRGHFAWIKNLSQLVNLQLTAKRCAKHAGDRCLHYFYAQEKLAAHSVDCGRMNDCAILFPNENDKWLSFDNYDKKERLPFVVYADLECVLERRERENVEGGAKTERYAYQRHVPFSLGYCTYDDTASANVYVIPLFFHNLSGYDAHFVVEKIANDFEGGVDLLPLTKETASIETLASYLNKDKLRITRSEYADLSADDLDLLTRKGVFPYEYVDSVDKLRETELPPREAFYSSQTDETASESD
ncbi:uncharacterized protein LOC143906623 [Temnothorax americanus]|uniref:uncharacterized protein LOC143906623 n=1 Tax=Temnothorax americanus TaxID=1964332 RepID=UPI004068FE36